MPALTLDSRPKLAESITFVESGADDGRWIVSAEDVPVSRVTPDVVALLCALDGSMSIAELRNLHGGDLHAGDFLSLIERFRNRGLLTDAERRAPGGFVFRPPLTVQFATLRAPAVFHRLDSLRRLVLRRWMLAIVLVMIVGGATALAAQAPIALSLLTRPLPVSSLLTIVATLLVATLIHEAAHGMTLAGHGELPRRAGVMFFYMSPAFFVDVTNGWRLPRRRSRVAVALAGPIVHAALGGASALAAILSAEHPPVRDTFLVLSLASWSIAAVNLIPFVRFDGYLALMSALDLPHLRASAITDVRDAAAHRLFGARRTQRRLPQRWVLPFGLLSILAPVVLIVFGIDRILRALEAGGSVGAWASLVVLVAVAVAIVASLVAAVRRLRAGGARGSRIAIVGSLLAAIVVAPGFVVSTRTTVAVGFVASDVGVRLVTVGSADPLIREGADVTLATQGVLGREALAEGTVSESLDASIAVPVGAVYPVTAPGATLPGRVVAVVAVDDPHRLPHAGIALVRADETTLWDSFWNTNILRPLAALN